MHRFLVAGLVGAGLLAGCDPSEGRNQPIQSQVALENFDNCGELESYIEDTAVAQMRAQLLQLKESSYGWGGIPVMVAEDASAGGSPRASGPSAYTTTNTQVEGVDEADFVKNDGTRMFVLSGTTLYVNQSWPADQLQTVARLALEGYPREMYLDGDRLAIFSSVYADWASAQTGGGLSVMPCEDPVTCHYASSNTLKVTVVDVSTLASPRVVRELYLPGYYVNSRLVDGRVRLVTGDSLRWPEAVQWYPSGDWQNPLTWGPSIDALIASNERLIRAAPLEQWLPEGRYLGADGELHTLGYQCSEFSRANAPTRLGVVSVVTLPLDPSALSTALGAGLQRASVLAEAGEVYASPTALYVASGHWWWWPEPGQTDHTYLHKFDITNPARAVYVASGGVDGHLVDQFSMDEHQGVLRVATTANTRVEDEANEANPWGQWSTTNRITVLGQQGSSLVKVGESEAIAEGESIYSARFMGDKAYVVTFLQVDPLFTFDLSDPTHPRKVGELKVPGFSTYIHPLDEGHLLTIGTSAGGWGSSLQLSIFDVTDFANPRLKFTQEVGTASGWSEAAYDHKAFNYFPERGLLAIPFADWNTQASTETEYWGSFVSDLRVFKVSTETGFTPKGALGMNDLIRSETHTWGSETWTYSWSPAIRRSVMADNFVYAISDAGIRVADVDSLQLPLTTTVF
ncbi:MAG: beta-propeller domain-containing protein [Myxococcota bacterium]|nr:beta-propeller domain-containing protein [Myxococcota bacterium]